MAQNKHSKENITGTTALKVATTTTKRCECGKLWFKIVEDNELWHMKVRRVVTIMTVIKRWTSFKNHAPRTRSRTGRQEVAWLMSWEEREDAERVIFSSVQRVHFH